MTSTIQTADRIYTETTGTTCYLAGQRGTVTGLRVTGLHSTATGLGRTTIGAFVQLDGPVDARGTYLAPGPMLYVELGAAVGSRGQSHEVVSWRVIDRDEFDRINEIDTLRRELGWTA